MNQEWNGQERRGEDRLLDFMKDFRKGIEDRLDKSHIENRENWDNHRDRDHKTIEEQQKSQDVKLESHDKDIERTKTLFGVISWASGAAWTGLLAWVGLGHK